MLTLADAEGKIAGPTLGFRDNTEQLSKTVAQTLQEYFDAATQEDPVDLYRAIISKAEVPLLEMVMERYRYNQSQVAHVLGLSRGTLRSKLRHYFDDKYVGTRAKKKVEQHEDVA
ncbi:MAG: helix-turn-helix domain-containing protein [Gammaproteobacteria bacterium]